MSSGNKFHFENNHEDFAYQYDWDAGGSTGIISALHIDYKVYGKLYNKKVFLDVVGDNESPKELQGIRYKAFRTVSMVNNEIKVEMAEQYPIAGRIWVAHGTLNASETFDWLLFLNNDYWVNIVDPVFARVSTLCDLTVYEGMELYGNVFAKINAITAFADIHIHCKYNRTNTESTSTGSFEFISIPKLMNALGLGGHTLSSVYSSSSTVNIENWKYGDPTNFLFGYAGISYLYARRQV